MPLKTKGDLVEAQPSQGLVNLVSSVGGWLVIISAYLYFVGFATTYYFYGSFGIPLRVVEQSESVYAIVANSYTPISQALSRDGLVHFNASRAFVMMLLMLVILFSAEQTSLRLKWLIRPSAMIVIALFLHFSVLIARESASVHKEQLLKDVRTLACVYFKGDVTKDLPPGFLDNQKRRCALQPLTETSDLIFFLDRNYPLAMGGLGHLLTIRRDNLVLVDTVFPY